MKDLLLRSATTRQHAERARTAVLMSRVRLAGVAVGCVQAWLVSSPPPISRWAVFGLSLVMFAYNLGPAFARRIAPDRLETVVFGALVGDFLVCGGWMLLTANDVYSTAYAVFTLVGFEAAVLYGWRGAGAASAGFLVLFGLLYVERFAVFHFGLDPASFLYRSALVLMVTAFAAGNAAQLAAEKERLRRSEEQTRLVVESAISAVVTADEEGRITGWNPRAEEIFGWKRAEILGRHLATTIFPSKRRREYTQWLRGFLQEGRPAGPGGVLEMTVQRRSGEEFPIDASVAAANDPDGRRRLVAYIQDITDRKRSEALQAARYAVTYAINQALTLEDGLPAILQGVCTPMAWPLGAFWFAEAGGRRLRFEALWHEDGVSGAELAAVFRSTALAPGEGLAGKAWAADAPVGSAEVDGGNPGALRDQLRSEGLHGGLAFPVRHGSEVLGILAFYAHEPQVADDEVMVAMADIGVQVGQWLERERVWDRLRQEEEARRLAEEKARRALEFRAFHDLLTGLPNRQLFADRLGQSLALAKREQKRVPIMLLDLDGFKAVNDRFGHHAGDVVLEEVADRLRQALRSSDTAARMGGDEFAILPGGDADEEAVRQIAEKVLEAFQERPWLVEGEEVSLGVSIGISFFPDHGQDQRGLLESADAAMYAAKRTGQGYAIFAEAARRRNAAAKG